MEEKEYKYLVGVRCFTFNQSKYILDALNGFVMQQTNFPFVVMVVDDASTDGEQEVIRQFVSEQFDLADTNISYEKETDYAYITYAQHKTNKNCYIVAMYLKENHYSQRKPKMPYLAEWRDYEKYEALCEGDDYWIHPKKLQMQVDFLEENEEYSMCHTAFEYKSENNSLVPTKKIDVTTRNLSIINSSENLIYAILDSNRYLIQTMTVLIKKEAYDKACIDLDEQKGLFLMGDTQLWISLLKYGKINFLTNITSVYRLHKGSACRENNISKRIRFILSCSEMRVFMAEKYNLPYEIQKKFQQDYQNNLSKYLCFDRNYEPFIQLKFYSQTEKIKFNIVNFKIIRFLRQIYYIIKYMN